MAKPHEQLALFGDVVDPSPASGSPKPTASPTPSPSPSKKGWLKNALGFGPIPKGIGGKLLWGGGALGSVWMALELMKLLSEGSKTEVLERARDRDQGWKQDNLETLLSPSRRDRLAASEDMLKVASKTRDYTPIMSDELRLLLGDEGKQLARHRITSAPSIKEAYARAGLVSGAF